MLLASASLDRLLYIHICIRCVVEKKIAKNSLTKCGKKFPSFLQSIIFAKIATIKIFDNILCFLRIII